MKKGNLKTINILLVILLIPTIASSIILEYLGGGDARTISNTGLIIIHILVATALMILSYRHIKLHFGALRNWRSRICKTRKQNRWLLTVSAITLLTGIIATAIYFLTGNHNIIGAVHGKIGYIAIFIMLLHLLQRRKWLRNLFDRNHK